MPSGHAWRFWTAGFPAVTALLDRFLHALAEHFGVDDHTVGKAVRCFRGEL